MRNIFIGDIHGCYDEFQGLVQKLDLKENDMLYLVGDMINKGPASFEVLQYIHTLGSRCRAILGNHETKFLENFESICNSPEPTLFQDLAQKLQGHPYLLEYLQSLPQYIEEPSFTVVHAGILPGSPVSSQEKLLGHMGKILPSDWYKSYTGEKPIIYGHWSEIGLNIQDKTIGIDSGCVDGGFLTAFILETRKIVQELCREKNRYHN